MSDHLPAVDTYIANARPFAQPILLYLRTSLHRAVPDAVEAIKWSRPFFLYRGIILANVAAFQEHCSFGLWGAEMADELRARRGDTPDGMGSFGKLRSVDDLPPAPELEALLRKAAGLIAEGTRTRSIQRVAKPRRPEAVLPEALTAALGKDAEATARFAAMSPSCRREYAEWIAGAKRDETRTRRVAAALDLIRAGRSRDWRPEATT